MQQKREINKRMGYCCEASEDQPMVTDMLATLFGELSAMFTSFSKIARTVVGLKEQLGNMQKNQGMFPDSIEENIKEEGNDI